MNNNIEKWKSEVGGITCQCGNPIDIERVNNFWIEKLKQREQEIVEKIEGMKKRNDVTPDGLSDVWQQAYNKALEKILSVIREG